MEKVDVTIQIEVERLDALNFFLFNKENTSLKTELQKVVENLYIKHVPEDTRRFIERKNKHAPGTRAKPKRSPRSSPVVSYVSDAEVDQEVQNDEQ